MTWRPRRRRGGRWRSHHLDNLKVADILSSILISNSGRFLVERRAGSAGQRSGLDCCVLGSILLGGRAESEQYTYSLKSHHSLDMN